MKPSCVWPWTPEAQTASVWEPIWPWQKVSFCIKYSVGKEVILRLQPYNSYCTMTLLRLRTNIRLKKNLYFQMPFQAFLHINALLIEVRFEYGWLHITWGWTYALLRGLRKKKASRCRAPVFREHFSTLHFSSHLDIADITACQLPFCKPTYAELCEI